MVIAIDGPAGSGKSTVARLVARQLGFMYVDTGAMYRAVTLAALERGVSLDDQEKLSLLARSLDLRLEPVESPDGESQSRVFLDGREVTQAIRSQAVTAGVSQVSACAGVREALTELQRSIACSRDVVLEGRDIGTVVCPEAEIKVFLTASLRERARRRHAQLAAQGMEVSLQDVEQDIQRRDKYDSSRTVAPLRKATDAVELDTTGLTVDEVVRSICNLVAARGV